MKHIKKIDLSQADREELLGIVSDHSSTKSMKLRTKIILMTSDERNISVIEKTLSTTRATIVKWKSRFLESGIAGLNDKTRSGPSEKYSKKIKEKIRRIYKDPPNDLKHHSIVGIAEYLGINRGIVQRIVKQENIKKGNNNETTKINNPSQF